MNTKLLFVVAFYLVLVVPSVLHALLYKRHSRSALGWIAFILVTPGFGAILYVLFGVNRVRTRSRKLTEAASDSMRSVDDLLPEGELESWRSLEHARAHFSEVEVAILRSGSALTRVPLSPNNRVLPLHNGEEAFPEMLASIRNAKSHVWLTTYIFETNPTGREFIDELSAAKLRGVDVRVVLDGVGELYYWPFAGRALRKAGVPFARFLRPKLIPPQIFANLRNHRKLLVVDGIVAFTGGMNIGGRHMVFDPANKAPVQDLHFSLEGPIVRDFETMFLHDWVFSNRHDGDREAELPTGTQRERLRAARDLRRKNRQLKAQEAHAQRSALPIAPVATGDDARLETTEIEPTAPEGEEPDRTPAVRVGEEPVRVADDVKVRSSRELERVTVNREQSSEAQLSLHSLDGAEDFYELPDDYDAWCRLIVDGPDHDLSKLETLISSVLSSAQKRIVMFSPYFLPTESIESALVNAALRGVDVTVVIPEKSNEPLVHAAMYRNIDWLLKRGVKLMLQPQPFAHTKLLIIDERYVQMGSANMDPRSLRLNFELAVEVMDQGLVKKLMDHYEPVIAASTRLTPEMVRSRTVLQKAGDGIAWLFSPYL